MVPGKEDVRSEVELQDGLIFIDIFSQSGLGNAEVLHPTYQSHESIVIRLHLSGLENMHIEGQDSTVQASVSSIPLIEFTNQSAHKKGNHYRSVDKILIG